MVVAVANHHLRELVGEHGNQGCRNVRQHDILAAGNAGPGRLRSNGWKIVVELAQYRDTDTAERRSNRVLAAWCVRIEPVDIRARSKVAIFAVVSQLRVGQRRPSGLIVVRVREPIGATGDIHTAATVVNVSLNVVVERGPVHAPKYRLNARLIVDGRDGVVIDRQRVVATEDCRDTAAVIGTRGGAVVDRKLIHAALHAGRAGAATIHTDLVTVLVRICACSLREHVKHARTTHGQVRDVLVEVLSAPGVLVSRDGAKQAAQRNAHICNERVVSREPHVRCLGLLVRLRRSEELRRRDKAASKVLVDLRRVQRT